MNIQEDALPELLDLTRGRGRVVLSPTPLIAITMCGERDFDIQPWNPLEFPLLHWSRDHRDATIVYAYVQCQGGTCDQAGFVCREGQIVHVETMAEVIDNDATPLGRLLSYLGIKLRGGHFEPLSRDFFVMAVDTGDDSS